MTTQATTKAQLFRKTALATGIMASALMTSLTAQAFDFNIGSGEDIVEMEWNNHLTYGAMMRLEDPSEENTVARSAGSPIAFVPAFPPDVPIPMWLPIEVATGAPYNPNFSYADAAQSGRINNSNDGNQNFSKNSLVQNRISVISELSINYKMFGAFVRGRAWYDDVYENRQPSSWDPANGYNHSDNLNTEFRDETKDYLGARAEFLDAYVFGSWVGSNPGSVKVGKQVINWGESMVFANSVNSAINPADANAGTRAGVDLKEVFMPTEAVYFQLGLTQKISMQAFYQWKHRGTEVLASGSFFSETDMLGRGGNEMWAGPDLIALDDRTGEVEDGGQYGLAFQYFTDSGTEYGIYYVNAHDKAPSLQVMGNTYQTRYLEDRQVMALSFSTVVGEANISGELSYRPNAPVVLDATCVDLSATRAQFEGAGLAIGTPYPGDLDNDFSSCTDHAPSEVAEAGYTQAQVSMVYVFGNGTLWDQANMAAEIVGWNFGDIDRIDDFVNTTGQPFESGTFSSEKDEMFFNNTPNGIGTFVRFGMDWYNLFSGVNLSVPLTWQYGWSGTNSRNNSREGASVFSIGATLLFPSNVETGLTYTRYDGEDDDQTDPTFYHLNDRDNLAFIAKYSF